jgi:hypothetical protein
MFSHLRNLLNIGQNLYQKSLVLFIMVDSILNCKKKPHKIHMNEGQSRDI